MKVENTSGLKPLGVAVLVRTYVPEIESARSLIFVPKSAERQERNLETRAHIIEVGPEAWANERAPRAAVGDLVYISKFSGFVPVETADGKEYRLVNDRDIFALVTAKQEDMKGIES